MHERTPPRLAPGDTVALVAPSGPIDAERLWRGRRVLADLGLNVVLGSRIFTRRGYLAGPDVARAADLQEAWCDPEVAAVICARGGYGAGRLLDLIDWDAMKSAGSKILVGSSDITALHLAFARRLGLATVFGPMPACATLADPEGPEPYSLGHLHTTLFHGHTPTAVTGDRVMSEGRAVGPMIGGNLTLLAAMCGTPYEMRAEGHIVLLEDVGEDPYRIDRMLTQLAQNGAFDGVKGFALGSWVDCGNVLPILAERLIPLGVPILAGLPIGHGSPQFSVWLGTDGVIDTESCSLTGLISDTDKAP
ncbi:putative carboxypeptidase [Acrocarpospora pleiomorpha]|uniref:Putative carboxypeptidase n=1 Tax=Acrocarpospora pleiomorpha TaxID=90975 RepID=A0A5M3X7R6_9ACTN|nr:LD-carboxypeptidase [Acrocarpospora pleiomorpha]GES17715.1 putative carboxypeptidase [Acrocarpospora pleiomorpha]